MINFWKLSYKLVKEQRDQCKVELRQCKSELHHYRDENEQLKQTLNENYYHEWQNTLEDARHFAIKCLDLEKENKKLKEENEKLKGED